jgi:hypothetical protein
MGGKQPDFSDYELTTPKKQTKREKFLSEMEVAIAPLPMGCWMSFSLYTKDRPDRWS